MRGSPPVNVRLMNVSDSFDMRTLKRWQVNHICHSLVKNYAKIARSLDDESYHLFKKSVLRDIALEYPILADECHRQIMKI